MWQTKVIITSKDGKVFSFDIQTGAKTLVKKISGKIEGQPIAKQGVLYIAVGGVVKVIKNAVNHSWFQWNKDGGHKCLEVVSDIKADYCLINFRVKSIIITF